MSRDGPNAATLTDTAFRILGPLEVVRQGIVREVPAGRQQALLAALLLRPNEIVPAPILVEQVWGDRSGADRSLLNVYVMRLRRSLGDHEHRVLRAERGGYRIAVDESAVDLHRFRGLCAEAAEARRRGDPERERSTLHEALALWHGDALAGIGSPLLQSEVVPILDEERLDAIERRVEADLECGAHAEVVRELRGLVADHPFRERFWCQLMVALHRSGRQGEVLEVYPTVCRRFADELGVEPGAELRDLHQRILAGDPVLPTRTGSSGPVTSTASGPAPRVVPAQLPPAAAGFSGRAEQLRQLDEVLERADATPIGLITGPPGVGKTALAVRWAERQRARCPDGQLYVDLRGYAPEAAVRPIEAVALFLRTTGVPADQVPGDLAEATALFRSMTADKRMLVLLDNAASVDQVRPLLPGGRNCVVVVTSRDQLAGLVVNEGVRRLVLDVLGDAEARAVLAGVIGEERLGAEPMATAELVRACGNLPLALRIAAADLAGCPCRGLADYVADLCAGNRLDAFEVAGDSRSAVRSTFRFSYAGLSPPVRRMFKLLGLFPGEEIGPETAAALANVGRREAAALLDQLVAAHLVTPRGADRLVLHDLLRLFAAELANEEDTGEERAAAVLRLYDHYTRTAEAAARRLYPHSEQLPLSPEAAAVPVDLDDAGASTWLDSERVNLVAVVRYAADHGPYLDACRLAASLHGYLFSKLHLVEWLSIARAGLSAARTVGHLRAQAIAHLSLAQWHRRRSQLRAAVGHFERALVLCRHDGWIEGEAVVHNDLSGVHDLVGSLRSTADHLFRASELNRRSGRKIGEAVILGNLGRVLLRMGRVSEAVAEQERSLHLHRQVGSRVGEARALTSLGEALGALGEHDRARELLARGIVLQQRLDDRAYLPVSLYRSAVVHLDAGEYERAADLARESIALRRRTGRRSSEAGPIGVLAAVDRCLGRHDSALERYREMRVLTRESGDWYLHVQALIGLASTCLDLGRPGQAGHHADRAAELARRFGCDVLEHRAAVIRFEVSSMCHRGFVPSLPGLPS